MNQPVPTPSERATVSLDEIHQNQWLDLSRGALYEAARRGDIPTIRIARRIMVPTAALRRMLALDTGEVAS